MTKGRVRCESDGDLYQRLAAGAGFGNVPATLESRRALARLHAREGSLDATIAITKHIRAVAAEHQESDHMRPVEQDINLRVATEDSVDLLWAGSVNVWLSTEERRDARCHLAVGGGEEPGGQDVHAAVDDGVVAEAARKAAVRPNQ